MVQIAATTVTGYLDLLPPDRRKTISAVRKVIRANLPAGFKETTGYGMICYSVPLKTYPTTYNGQPLCYAALASQKNYCSLYLTGDTWVRRRGAFVPLLPKTRPWIQKADVGSSA